MAAAIYVSLNLIEIRGTSSYSSNNMYVSSVRKYALTST